MARGPRGTRGTFKCPSKCFESEKAVKCVRAWLSCAPLLQRATCSACATNSLLGERHEPDLNNLFLPGRVTCPRASRITKRPVPQNYSLNQLPREAEARRSIAPASSRAQYLCHHCQVVGDTARAVALGCAKLDLGVHSVRQGCIAAEHTSSR